MRVKSKLKSQDESKVELRTAVEGLGSGATPATPATPFFVSRLFSVC